MTSILNTDGREEELLHVGVPSPHYVLLSCPCHFPISWGHVINTPINDYENSTTHSLTLIRSPNPPSLTGSRNAVNWLGNDLPNNPTALR